MRGTELQKLIVTIWRWRSRQQFSRFAQFSFSVRQFHNLNKVLGHR